MQDFCERKSIQKDRVSVHTHTKTRTKKTKRKKTGERLTRHINTNQSCVANKKKYDHPWVEFHPQTNHILKRDALVIDNYTEKKKKKSVTKVSDRIDSVTDRQTETDLDLDLVSVVRLERRIQMVKSKVK